MICFDMIGLQSVANSDASIRAAAGRDRPDVDERPVAGNVVAVEEVDGRVAMARKEANDVADPWARGIHLAAGKNAVLVSERNVFPTRHANSDRRTGIG